MCSARARGSGTERHFGQTIHDAGFRRRRNARGLRRDRPAVAAQVGQSSVGQEYLLPAFTAALLGATSVRPGRVNVWGTVLAVAVLAVTVAGLNQLGAPFFVEPLFNGSMLILAVGLAVQAAGRRQRRGTEAETAARRRDRRRSPNRERNIAMDDGKGPRPDTFSPILSADWFNSRWAPTTSAAPAI